MVETCDCIVLGLGGVGSATAAAIAARGWRVIGLEQFGLAHDRGSSHGETRIIRKAYFEHPDYVPLLTEAFTGWRELEARSGRRLFDPTGLVLSGPAECEAIAGTLQAAREHHLPLDLLTPREAADRFPAFQFDAQSVVLVEREAGRLHVEACVQTHLDRAAADGARLRFHESVTHWTGDDRGVRVYTDRSIYSAARLVISAGPWAARLLAGLAVPLRVLRKVQLWYSASESVTRQLPCFYFHEADRAFYGIPSPGGGLVKAAEHTRGEHVADPGLVDGRLRPSDVAALELFIAGRLPHLQRSPVRHSVCLYTMSPDGHFLVDRHPGVPAVCFAAGLSGHGFKFAGVLGRALADLAIDGGTSLPIDFLGLSRLNARSDDRDQVG